MHPHFDFELLELTEIDDLKRIGKIPNKKQWNMISHEQVHKAITRYLQAGGKIRKVKESAQVRYAFSKETKNNYLTSRRL